MKRIAFIIHGRIAQNTKLMRKIESVFKGYDYKCYSTSYAYHAPVLTQQAISDGYNYIICIGGDGSLNEVVNGILSANTSNKIYLGLLPYGTGNDFAKTLNISTDVAALKQYIDNDLHQATDAGIVSYTDRNNKAASRYFINITDVGMGGVAAEKINSYPRWLPATIAYQLAIVSTILTYKKKDMIAKASNFNYSGRTMNIIVANGKYFGSGLGIAPHAKTNDGKFGLVIAADISLWDYITNIGTVRKCEIVKHPQMQYHSVTDIEVSANEPMAIDMDGEFIGYSPMRVQVLPNALNFLCPKQA